jgi:hypothetical protein
MAERPVIEPQIDFIESSEMHPRDKEDDDCGDCPEQQTGGDFAHRYGAWVRAINA